MTNPSRIDTEAAVTLWRVKIGRGVGRWNVAEADDEVPPANDHTIESRNYVPLLALRTVEAERNQLKEQVSEMARELLTVRDESARNFAERDRLAAALESIAKLTERGPEHERATWYDASDEAGLIAREALGGCGRQKNYERGVKCRDCEVSDG